MPEAKLVVAETFREIIATLIHAGWYGWMVGRGYTYGPECDDALKTHPHLLVWSDLKETEKESTYVAADSVVSGLVDFELVILGKVVKGPESQTGTRSAKSEWEWKDGPFATSQEIEEVGSEGEE